MPVIELKFDNNTYDFALTLFPSFNYVFFEQINNTKWAKVYGKIKLVLEFNREGFIKVNYDNKYKVSLEYILDITGLWFDPLEQYSKLPRGKRELIEPLISKYQSLRLSINNVERGYIFVAVALARRTNFHLNTVRWCRKLFSLVNSIDDILSLNLEEISTSYQVLQLKDSLKDYLSIREMLNNYFINRDLACLRKYLLRIKWFGTKSADAFILFSSRLSHSTPCDIHYQRFVKRLNLLNYRYLPNKHMCIKYSCELCPYNSKCLYYLSTRYFGPLSGWVQTVAYVHDKMYCSKKRCRTCPFRRECFLPASHKLKD